MDELTTREGNQSRSGRFTPPNEKRKYEVVELREGTKEIIRRILLGETNVSIAQQMDMSPQQVSNIRNSQLVQDQLEILEAARDASSLDVSQQIQKVAPKALAILTSTVDLVNKKLADDPLYSANVTELNTARDLLDRAGHGVIRKNINVSQNAHLNDDELDKIKREVEKAKASANIVEVPEAETIDS